MKFLLNRLKCLESGETVTIKDLNKQIVELQKQIAALSLLFHKLSSLSIFTEWFPPKPAPHQTSSSQYEHAEE